MKKTNLFLAMAFAAAMSACNCPNEQKCEKENSGNSVLECIMTRTSIRQYTAQPVEQEKIDAMLRAGMAAPTAVNKQPWHFVVVNDTAKLAELATACPNNKMLKTAPLVIVVCGDFSKTLEGKGQEFWIQDCSAATENILLAAHAQGLGAVWTAAHPMEERVEALSNTLRLPDTLVPLCAITIGYPAENPTPKDKWKSENVTYNGFGN